MVQTTKNIINCLNLKQILNKFRLMESVLLANSKGSNFLDEDIAENYCNMTTPISNDGGRELEVLLLISTDEHIVLLLSMSVANSLGEPLLLSSPTSSKHVYHI